MPAEPISQPVTTTATQSDAVGLHRSVDDQTGEVVEINPHTQSAEFHGKTSSLAFLSSLLLPSGASGSKDLRPQALVSTLHNDSFSPQAGLDDGDLTLQDTKFFFRQSQRFLEGFFQNIHFIHPFIDQSAFYARCESLWFGNEQQTRGFLALYFAVMSLGALTREWSEDRIDGLTRWDWSRKLFRLASLALGTLPLQIDLETVQASIIMAKVCQNELNPSFAYAYLGQAVRTSLSAGYNRNSDSNMAIRKTWWALYSVEIEMSFSLGRPDSLGADFYHNCALPPVENNETAVITPMVDLARIIRKVAGCVYQKEITIDQRMDLASQLAAELDSWTTGLPEAIRPRLDEPTEDLGVQKDPMWAKKQRHTLRFRYYNITMVLYRPFLQYTTHFSGSSESLEQALSKCVAAARSTIRLMHHMYSTASYFKTWFYNVTYLLYAASIILAYRTRLAPRDARAELLQLIRMSVEILRAMDENIVAKKAADLLQAASDQVLERNDTVDERTRSRAPIGTPNSQSATYDAATPLVSGDLLLEPLIDENFDFLAQLFTMNEADSEHYFF